MIRIYYRVEFYILYFKFKFKIVVTGGQDNYCETLSSVKAYDYYENKSTYLTDMTKTRLCHSAFTVGNKMFAMGGFKTKSCKVLDNFTRQFTEIKSDLITNKISRYLKAVCIGNNILVFRRLIYRSETIIYLNDVFV